MRRSTGMHWLIVRAELELLDRGIERAFENAVDRDRARVADSQGLGAASLRSAVG